MGGGFELALACDLRVAGRRARFALPELGLGLIPAAGGIRRLVDLVGTARTKEIVLFGAELDAARADAWGLVRHVEEDCLAKAIALAAAAAQRRAGDAGLEALGQALLYLQRAKP